MATKKILNADVIERAGGLTSRTRVFIDEFLTRAEGGFSRVQLFDKDSDSLIPGHFIANAGALQANADYTVSNFIPLAEGQKITLTRGRHHAFYDADGGFISKADSSSSPSTLTGPEGCAWLRVSVHTPTDSLATFRANHGETLLPWASYSTLLLNEETAPSLTALVGQMAEVFDAFSDFAIQDIEQVEGYYINRSTGAITAHASFRYAMIEASPQDQIKVTAEVNGTGVALAVYYTDADAYISAELLGESGGPGIVSDYLLTIPPSAAKIGITSRIGVPIVARKKELVSPASSSAGAWAGKLIDVMGDSNVQQNKWQPLVAAELGCAFLNHGVGGSKVAKPDSAENQVSMCDDARVNALDTDADAWIVGPALTNDWAQNIPIGTMASTEDTTVYGALKIMFAKMIARAPDNPIFAITPFNTDYDEGRNGSWVDGSTNQHGSIYDYAQAMREVAARFGIPVIDINAETGWTAANSDSFLLTEGSGNTSRLHLNSDTGPARMAARVIAGLQRLTP